MLRGPAGGDIWWVWLALLMAGVVWPFLEQLVFMVAYRLGWGKVRSTLRRHDRELLWCAVLAVAALVAGTRSGTPWGTGIVNAEEPVAVMLAVSAALVALIVFAAERRERFAETDSPTHLGYDLRAFLEQRSTPSRLLRLPLTGGLLLALFILPLADSTVPAAWHVAEGIVVPVRLIARAFWCGAVAVVSLVLLLDVTRALRSEFGLKLGLEGTKQSLEFHVDEQERALVRRAMRFSGARMLRTRTVRRYEYAARLAPVESVAYLERTSPRSELYWLATRPASSPWRRLIPVARGDAIASLFRDWAWGLVDARRHLAVPETARQDLLEQTTSELVTALRAADVCWREWSAGDRPDGSASTLLGPSDVNDRYPVRFRQGDPPQQVLEVAAILFSELLGWGAAAPLTAQELWRLREALTRLAHGDTRDAYADMVVDRLLRYAADDEAMRADVLGRHEQEVPRPPGGAGVDADAPGSIAAGARRLLFDGLLPQSLPYLEMLLALIDDPATLRRILLFNLFYAARSRSSVEPAALLAFAARLRAVDQPWRAGEDFAPNSAFAQGTVELLARTIVSHFVKSSGVSWLIASLGRPMSVQLCREFLDRDDIFDFGLLEFWRWHAVGRGAAILRLPSEGKRHLSEPIPGEELRALHHAADCARTFAKAAADVRPGWEWPFDIAVALAEIEELREPTPRDEGWLPGIPVS
ncbi:hypothetical protein USB125703_00714 [Pseudoclavibacter triregionum]|nr:hypothetical protein USB125703_00714 [Pseudoclavibacter triregionum]